MMVTMDEEYLHTRQEYPFLLHSSFLKIYSILQGFEGVIEERVYFNSQFQKDYPNLLNSSTPLIHKTSPSIEQLCYKISVRDQREEAAFYLVFYFPGDSIHVSLLLHQQTMGGTSRGVDQSSLIHEKETIQILETSNGYILSYS